MKKINILLLVMTFGFVGAVNAQETQSDISKNTKEDKLTYYEKRALEDAKYEQQFNAENENEKAFWDDQKHYEKSLKKKDRKAYKAYMKGKKDAYAEHHAHCDSHCHHSEYYYHHATFYYRGYYSHESSTRRRSTINARVNVPRVRLSIF